MFYELPMIPYWQGEALFYDLLDYWDFWDDQARRAVEG